jgi:hypothetical protein
MTIPEAQLETWSHQGSVIQSSTAYATVKTALEESVKFASGILHSDLPSLRKQPHGDGVVVAGTYVPLFVELKVESTFERGAQLPP